ncbi:MAG: DUF1573 domain-containing protein [Deltaproteobacteria bacterium]|nr:DUF1573 domain-containing protein [Deltaproteobacteria bacterium]
MSGSSPNLTPTSPEFHPDARKRDHLRFGGIALLLLTGLTAVFLSACANNAGSSEAGNSGKVVAESALEQDLGQVNIRGGIVQRTFDLRNQGENDLVLKGVFTSCACTTASIELPDGRVLGKFGKGPPKSWRQVIKPGESFKVHVNFDPLFHGENGVGPFTRSVFLITSAPADDNLSTRIPLIKDGTVTTIRLSGTVVYADDFRKTGVKNADDDFGEVLGDFRFTEKEYDFGITKQSQGIVRHEFPFIYTGGEPVTITGIPTSCGCTRAYVTKTKLKPGEKGTLVVEFDPNFHEEPKGRFFRTITLLTDPVSKERVELKIWTQVDLDLGPKTYKFREHDKDEKNEGSENDSSMTLIGGDEKNCTLNC